MNKTAGFNKMEPFYTLDIRKENPVEDIWSHERKPVMEN